MDEVNFITMLRFFWLDTSALVKIFIEEEGSAEIKKVFKDFHQNIFYTTEFCVYEYYNVLKRKYLHNQLIDEETYLRSIFILSTYLKLGTIRYNDTKDSFESIFLQTRKIVKKYSLDYSDAIQFVLIQKGLLETLAGESRPVLITSDKGMIRAAELENIIYWNSKISI